MFDPVAEYLQILNLPAERAETVAIALVAHLSVFEAEGTRDQAFQHWETARDALMWYKFQQFGSDAATWARFLPRFVLLQWMAKTELAVADQGLKPILNTFDQSTRKKLGAYYTPKSLITPLLDSALNPVIEQAVAKENPAEALLKLTICDPSCGSGNFLIQAMWRVAERLKPFTDWDLRTCARRVAQHCLYGVDLNPDVIEICKLAIQLSVLKVGEMPPFLDHKIKCGNALIGATPELMEKGIPDAAFSVLPGDDPKTVAKYRLQNRKERQKREAIERAKGRRQLGLFEGSDKE